MLTLVCIGLFMGGMPACAPDTVGIQRSNQFAPESIKRIALLPFSALPGSRAVHQSFGQGPVPYIDNTEVRPSFESTPGPVPMRSQATNITVPDSAPRLITKMVYTNLLSRPTLRTIAPDIAVASLPKEVPVAESMKSRDTVKKLSKTLEVDAILHGIVRVYRERQGSKLAAIPAAVGFEIYLVDGNSGIVLWKGDYFEEQKPATEDIRGFFSRGGTFVTAEELARSGVRRVMERF